MRHSSGIIFMLFVFSIFVTSCAWTEPTNKKEEEGMQQEISKFQNLYAKDFKAQEAVFEGIKVCREDTIINKKNKYIASHKTIS